MSTDDHKALVARRFQEFDDGDFRMLDELFAPNYRLNLPGSDEPLDLERTKQLYATLYGALPDLRHTIEDQIAEGDKVVTRWTARGTHRGDLLGHAGSGDEIVFSGINIYRIADGKLAESHVNWDLLGIVHQLGASDRRTLVD